MNLDVMLARRKMRLGELAALVGVSVPNLSILKTGKARAVRFSTLEAVCRALDCQPGDLLEFVPDPPRCEDAAQTSTDAADSDPPGRVGL